MRGKVKAYTLINAIYGITPAYAGKSGEKVGDAIGSAGSPPPMRGKEFLKHRFVMIRRITPAYAGKSQAGSLFHKRIGDHPRLCGEKSESPVCLNVKSGSPPPMRGKVPCPAVPCPRLPDHPRLCGEKSGVMTPNTPVAGSPPPMRGKDSYHIKSHCVIRITPAYAGKSYFFVFSPMWR